MQPQIHNHTIPCMHYPVGNFLTKNLKYLIPLAEEFVKFYGGAEKPPIIISRGSSGIFVGGYIATEFFNKTGKDVVVNVLRKTKNHHGHGDFEKMLKTAFELKTPLCIVDDFIDSGDTMKAIYGSIKETLQKFPDEPIIDSIFVTGSSHVSVEDHLDGVNVNHLFIQ